MGRSFSCHFQQQFSVASRWVFVEGTRIAADWWSGRNVSIWSRKTSLHRRQEAGGAAGTCKHGFCPSGSRESAGTADGFGLGRDLFCSTEIDTPTRPTAFGPLLAPIVAQIGLKWEELNRSRGLQGVNGVNRNLSVTAERPWKPFRRHFRAPGLFGHP